MAGRVDVTLKATGQALEVSAPVVVASGVIDFIQFNVEFGEEWDGFEYYAVLLKNGDEVRACEVSEGVAIADRVAVEKAGYLAVAAYARSGDRVLTTERVIIPLKSSGV